MPNAGDFGGMRGSPAETAVVNRKSVTFIVICFLIDTASGIGYSAAMGFKCFSFFLICNWVIRDALFRVQVLLVKPTTVVYLSLCTMGHFIVGCK